MATESNSNREKYVEVDRISGLPDSLLCHILSFLPTKQASTTSTLSTRWKLLWTMVPVLDFQVIKRHSQHNDGNNGHEIMFIDDFSMRMGFTHFVWRVLCLREPLHVKKFRLQLEDFNYVDPILIHAWICYAMEQGIEELQLWLLPGKPYELPLSLFSCESLKILELQGNILLKCPSSVHLPNLKRLSLRNILYSNEESFRSLLTGSPHLLRLEAWRFQPDDMITFNICHPTLEHIEIHEPRSNEHEINAPNLKLLLLCDRNCQDYLLDNSSNVSKARVDLFENDQQDDDDDYSHICIFELLRAVPKVQNLTLRYSKSVSFASIHYVPMHNSLTRLELQVRCSEWHLLPNLLGSAPNLENLVLNMMDTERSHKSCWTEPMNIPKCIESRLRRISLLRCRSFELELIKYILKNAKVLERMEIVTVLSGLKENFRTLMNVLELPRASSSCELSFYTELEESGMDHPHWSIPHWAGTFFIKPIVVRTF